VTIIRTLRNQAPVAHVYNLSYSEGREKACHLKPDQANSLKGPISKIPNRKQGWQSDSSGRAST
jgi:hypothetical protein